MAEEEGTIKKWGNSYGILVSSDIVKKEKLREGQKIKYIILKKSDVLKKTFGTLKLRKSSQQIKNELRKDLYDD